MTLKIPKWSTFITCHIHFPEKRFVKPWKGPEYWLHCKWETTNRERFDEDRMLSYDRNISQIDPSVAFLCGWFSCSILSLLKVDSNLAVNWSEIMKISYFSSFRFTFELKSFFLLFTPPKINVPESSLEIRAAIHSVREGLQHIELWSSFIRPISEMLLPRSGEVSFSELQRSTVQSFDLMGNSIRSFVPILVKTLIYPFVKNWVSDIKIIILKLLHGFRSLTNINHL